MTTPAPTSLSKGKLGGLKVRKAGDDSQYGSTIIYGDGGIGKTTLAASAIEVPEMCPVLHLNIENGAQSVKEIYPELEVVDIDTITDLQNVFRELHSKSGAGYETCILDNITEGQQQGIDHILETRKDITDFTEFESASFSNGAWSRSSEQMRKLVRYFRGLPMNTIFIAWKKNYSENNVPDWRPAFTKTFGGEAPGMVNSVYHYYKQGDNRVLQTEISDRAVAKDRTGKLPRLIKDPTYSKLNDYFTGKLVKPTAAEIAAAQASKTKTGVKK